MSIHSGHRERLREKFLNGGLSAFNEHEKLEQFFAHDIPGGKVLNNYNVQSSHIHLL